MIKSKNSELDIIIKELEENCLKKNYKLVIDLWEQKLSKELNQSALNRLIYIYEAVGLSYYFLNNYAKSKEYIQKVINEKWKEKENNKESLLFLIDVKIKCLTFLNKPYEEYLSLSRYIRMGGENIYNIKRTSQLELNITYGLLKQTESYFSVFVIGIILLKYIFDVNIFISSQLLISFLLVTIFFLSAAFFNSKGLRKIEFFCLRKVLALIFPVG